jgi:uncharacterized protein
MKFRQEFNIAEPVATVWEFFDQPTRVAACLPGLESCNLLDDGTLAVRLTQHLGPMAATFETRVRITERVPEERMQFTSTGKAVRGAVGNFRATNTVYLQAIEGGTMVVVEGEAALAGMLGAIGQKIILKQADKMTAEFAHNLERSLSGAGAAIDATPSAASLTTRAPATAGSVVVSREPVGQATLEACLRWAMISAALNGAALLVGMLILWRFAR